MNWQAADKSMRDLATSVRGLAGHTAVCGLLRRDDLLSYAYMIVAAPSRRSSLTKIRSVWFSTVNPELKSSPAINGHAPNVVWAIDFQPDSTVDGKAIKIA